MVVPFHFLSTIDCKSSIIPPPALDGVVPWAHLPLILQGFALDLRTRSFLEGVRGCSCSVWGADGLGEGLGEGRGRVQHCICIQGTTSGLRVGEYMCSTLCETLLIQTISDLPLQLGWGW